MDLLRVLGNHDNGTSATPVTGTTTIDQQNRNNGAFRTSFTPIEQPTPAANATNGHAVQQEQGSSNGVGDQGQRV